MVIEAVFFLEEVFKVPPQEYASSEFWPTICKTPISAETRSPSSAPDLPEILTALTLASSVALEL